LFKTLAQSRHFTAGNARYCALGVHAPDRLYLVDVPPPLRDAIKKAMIGQWKPGLQRVVPHKEVRVPFIALIYMTTDGLFRVALQPITLVDRRRRSGGAESTYDYRDAAGVGFSPAVLS
jgi:hypothetical protein